MWIKRTILLEFPIFVFDPNKHTDRKSSQLAESEEGRVGEGSRTES
jgi:hypothetical protein